MGSAEDPEAVVGADGAVRGTQGLRVIDSSTFPLIPNGNLNAPTIMTAEKFSDAILGLRALDPLPAAQPGTSGWVDPHWGTRQREGTPLRQTFEDHATEDVDSEEGQPLPEKIAGTA